VTRSELLEAWKRKEPFAPADVRAVFAASLALVGEPYEPTAANMAAIAARLRAAKRVAGAALAHEPKVPPPRVKPPPPPPPPPKGRLIGSMWMPLPPPKKKP
jgi:hypothetical protein